MARRLLCATWNEKINLSIFPSCNSTFISSDCGCFACVYLLRASHIYVIHMRCEVMCISKRVSSTRIERMRLSPKWREKENIKTKRSARKELRRKKIEMKRNEMRDVQMTICGVYTVLQCNMRTHLCAGINSSGSDGGGGGGGDTYFFLLYRIHIECTYFDTAESTNNWDFLTLFFTFFSLLLLLLAAAVTASGLLCRFS